jgi:hypothetical protein
VLHVHVLVPGPLSAHVAFESQPPPLAQASIGVQVVPSPVYPVLHAHETVLAPVEEQRAVVAHPPLFVAQPLIPVQVVPLPVYPVAHAHELVPGPVLVQVAFGSHAP